jgi:hypothetical protein
MIYYNIKHSRICWKKALAEAKCLVEKDIHKEHSNPFASCGFSFVSSFVNHDVWFYVSAIFNMYAHKRS